MSAKRALYLVVFFIAGAISIAPLIIATSGLSPDWLSAKVVAGLNLLGWSIVITFLISRADHHKHLIKVSKELGIDARRKSLEGLLDNLIYEIRRKQEALSISILEKKITSKEELSRSLERIVGLAYRLLGAESAELALFDRDTGLYHSSFVMGKPFRSSAQAMLSGTFEEGGEQEVVAADVLVQPVSFAGSVLGSLRVALKRGRLPSQSDHELLAILSLQSSIALINAQFTQELLQMRRVSEESVKAKTGFLANLSHELRGPLGIIMNSVELVLDGLCGPVNEDQLDTLKMVSSNGEHLLELINDVLDYAKIESGRVKPNTVEIEVNEILADISSVVRTQAETKSHRVIFKKSNELLGIACDRRHLRQILINLLTNAIKYTPDGGTIEVWAERPTSGKVKINVKDTGVGIGESDRYKVFSAFERIEHTYSSKQVGAGLGMSLTRNLVQLNGGSIDFTSSPNQGSVFWVVFPAIEYDPSMHRDAQHLNPVIEGRNEAVLLVLGDVSERNMFIRALHARGFRAAGASDAGQALLAIGRESFAAVVIDDHLIEESEDVIIKRIKESPNARTTPVIALTSRAFIFDTEKFLKQGVDRCISKPARFNELAQAIRETIDARESSASGYAGTSAGGNAAGNTASRQLNGPASAQNAASGKIEGSGKMNAGKNEDGAGKTINTKIMSIDDICH